MAKLTLSDLSSLTNEASAIALINANNALIEAALEKTLSRDGTSPNSMDVNLDMNSYRIQNLPAASTSTEPVRKAEWDGLMTQINSVYANTQAVYTNFNNRYLGVKSSDPTLDNSGNPLVAGALYYNDLSNTLKVYTSVSPGGWLTFTNSIDNVPLLDDLLDAIVGSAVTGDLLRFNGTHWVNYPGSNYAAASHTHTASQISDSTTAGRELLTGTDASAQRTSLGLGSLATKSTITSSDIADGAATLVKLDRTGTLGQVLAAQGSGNAPAWATISEGKWEYIGSGAVVLDESTLSFTNIGSYSQIVALVMFGNNDTTGPNGVSLALSSNNGSPYGTARTVMSASDQRYSVSGSITISNTNVTGNKTISPYLADNNQRYITTTTETVITGTINAIRFANINSIEQYISVALFGVP